MAPIANLVVRLSADVADFEKKIAGVERTLQRSGKNLESIGDRLTKGLSLPLAAVGGVALKAAVDFESSFAGIRKTVSATEGQFKQLSQGMRDLAKTIPINVNELNKLGESAGQLGVPTEKILEFTAVMAKLGVTTNLTADQAATSIAQIQNIFNASGKDTANFASALVALGNAGASTESQIVDFASRLSGAGHQIGLSQQAVLGFSSALANMGLNAELGGTALSQVMSKISVAVDTGGAKLEGFAKVAGLTGEQFKTLFKQDASEGIIRFVEGLGKAGVEGGNLTIILKELGLKGSNVQDVLKRLAGGADQMRSAVELSGKAWGENTALQKEAEQRFKTTASQLILLKNNLQDVAITFGNALLPSLNGVVSGSRPLVGALTGMAEAFAALPAPIRETSVALGLLFASIGPIAFVVGKVTQSWAALLSAVRLIPVAVGGVSTALLAVVTSLTGVSTGVTGLTGAVYLLQGAFTALTPGILVAGVVALVAASKEAAIGAQNLFVAWKEGHFVETVFSQDQASNWVQRLLGVETAAQRVAAATRQAAANMDIFRRQGPGKDINLSVEGSGDLASKLIGHDTALEVAKLTKAFNDLTPAQQRSADVLKRVGAEALRLKDAGAQLTPELDKLAKSAARIESKGMKDLATATDALRDRINGVDMVKQAKEWQVAIKGVGEETKVLADEHLRAEMLSVLDAIVDKFGSLKAAGLGSLERLRTEAKNFGDQIKDVQAEIVDLGKTIDDIQPLNLAPDGPGVKLGIDGKPLPTLPKPSGKIEFPKSTLEDNLFDTKRLADAFAAALTAGLQSGTVLKSVTATAIGIGQKFTSDLALYLTANAKSGGLAIGGFLGESLKIGLKTVSDFLGGGLGGFVASLKSTATGIAMDFTGEMLKMIPGIGPALAQLAIPVVEGIKSLFGHIFNGEGKKVNNLRDDFFAQFGGAGTGADSGFGKLAAQLHELGATGDEVFQKLIRADKIAEFQAAMEEATNALKTVTTDTANVTNAAVDAQQAAADGLQARIGELSNEFDQLNKSIANEAPEEEMGVIEKNTRARMEAVGKERDKVQSEWELVTQSIKDSLAGIGDAAKDAAQSIVDAFTGLKVPPVVVPVTGSSTGNGVPHLATGGLVRRPTLALVGERGPEVVIPLAQMGQFGSRGGDINVTLMMPDGEVLLRQMVKARRGLGL